MVTIAFQAKAPIRYHRCAKCNVVWTVKGGTACTLTDDDLCPRCHPSPQHFVQEYDNADGGAYWHMPE